MGNWHGQINQITGTKDKKNGMTIFSKIIAGEIPCYKIAEDDKFLSFLDINPLVEGHTLVIPKIEIDNFFDMPGDYLAQILLFARPLAKAIEKSFDCNRCGISVIGLEVPHAHMHLVPINTSDDLNFTRKKLNPSKEQLKAAQEKILGNL
jgi:histidine triad (HIT) family protein